MRIFVRVFTTATRPAHCRRRKRRFTTGETWLLGLAELIRQQSFDYPKLVADWPFKSKATKWTFEEHVVNLGMVLHSELLYQKLHPESETDGEAFAEKMLGELMKYHSMATGMFTGDECVAGDSPSQGTELCAVVEAMYSEELLLAATGNPPPVSWNMMVRPTH